LAVGSAKGRFFYHTGDIIFDIFKASKSLLPNQMAEPAF
jgi:hypothetical protein